MQLSPLKTKCMEAVWHQTTHRMALLLITVLARDSTLRGAPRFERNRVRNIRLMYTQNDFTHKMAATAKRLATSIACIKGHLETTHLKSSPLFTVSTKSLGQDSPSIHLVSKIIGSRFTTAKIKLGEDSPSWFVFSRSRFTFKQRK